MFKWGQVEHLLAMADWNKNLPFLWPALPSYESQLFKVAILFLFTTPCFGHLWAWFCYKNAMRYRPICINSKRFPTYIPLLHEFTFDQYFNFLNYKIITICQEWCAVQCFVIIILQQIKITFNFQLKLHTFRKIVCCLIQHRCFN